VPLKAPLPPQRLGFLPTQEFWELAMYTPFWPLCLVGYICLIEALAYLLGVSGFTWWQHVLLAIALTEIWTGIVEFCCRRFFRLVVRQRRALAAGRAELPRGSDDSGPPRAR
jgi:hypothetical protein